MNMSVTLPSSVRSSGFYESIDCNRISQSKSSGMYTPSPADFIGSFYAVLNRWRSETAFYSDPQKITEHPSYVALLENAIHIVPLIVAELRLRPSLLVWILDDTFQDRPYRRDDLGDITAMSEAWVAWAEGNGRILR